MSTAGTAVTSIAAILLPHNAFADRGVADEGTAAFVVAAFLAALVIPTIATMGVAGRVADTVDSRLVLTVTALVQAAAVTALGFAPVPAMIFVTGVIIALAQAFAQPTWSALVPRVVGEEKIGQAISWQQGLAAVASPIGAAFGGLLVTLDDVAWGFWADAATYLLLAGAALLIRTRRKGAGIRIRRRVRSGADRLVDGGDPGRGPRPHPAAAVRLDPRVRHPGRGHQPGRGVPGARRPARDELAVRAQRVLRRRRRPDRGGDCRTHPQ
ncbi:MFS transporter [Microbacterium elymi]|uniref:MFS transporter n=1 Tax=Microbacterium elymi TaxID=2909587 RepID=A0ABY5NHD3_9MICO|nr:MFS transporter [Microbacterium elymi]UUT34577.1 MFS transporter [Microbacterium elymi]